MVPREGGDARRLVTGFGQGGGPIFSPDGSRIAFSGDYNGNIDVYVVDAGGGEPKRLTYHPGRDVAVGWTPDGKNVLFRSASASYSDPDQLYTVPANGGFPTELPLTMAESGSYSPDASHLAYVPNFRWEPDWKGYRGGQTTPIYLADLADSSIRKVPRDNSNDDTPMVDRRHGILSLRSRRPGHALRVRHALANGSRASCRRAVSTSRARRRARARSCTRNSVGSRCSIRRRTRRTPCTRADRGRHAGTPAALAQGRLANRQRGALADRRTRAFSKRTRRS